MRVSFEYSPKSATRSTPNWFSRVNHCEATQRRLAEQLGVLERIVETGEIPNESLVALYSGALVFLFPSRFEGFGWPIIEAQSCGCPVICSNRGPLPEVAGGSAWLRDIEDEDGFAADIVRLYIDEKLRNELIEQGDFTECLAVQSRNHDCQIFVALRASPESSMTIVRALTLFLPWPVRRWVLNWTFGYRIHRDSRIGFAWVFPAQLVMDAHSQIGHLTVCKGLELLELGPRARIGRGNWITGYPKGSAKHFTQQPERRPCLILGEHASITNRHLIDCTNAVSIGAFTTLAGFRSQILTHSIDMATSTNQCSAPVSIGKYCFVGYRLCPARGQPASRQFRAGCEVAPQQAVHKRILPLRGNAGKTGEEARSGPRIFLPPSWIRAVRLSGRSVPASSAVKLPK